MAAAADRRRAAGEPLEDRRHDAQRPGPFGQHDPGPDDRDADPLRLGGVRRLLPLAADDRHEVGARGALLGQLLVAVRAVVADGRPLDEDRRGLLRLGDGRHEVLGRVDAAVADRPLHGGIPAVGEDVVPGQVDDRVAALEADLPAAGLRRVARDDLEEAHRVLAADGVGAARQDDRLVAALDQPPDQVPADQARPARDEDAHRRGPRSAIAGPAARRPEARSPEALVGPRPAHVKEAAGPARPAAGRNRRGRRHRNDWPAPGGVVLS